MNLISKCGLHKKEIREREREMNLCRRSSLPELGPRCWRRQSGGWYRGCSLKVQIRDGGDVGGVKQWRSME